MPFKKGPFAVAMKAGVPVVPVVIEGSGKLMPKNSWNITPGPVTVMLGEPIDPKQFGDDRDDFRGADIEPDEKVLGVTHHKVLVKKGGAEWRRTSGHWR